MLSYVYIKHKGHNVRVGSGFSIEQRQEYHENKTNILGKLSLFNILKKLRIKNTMKEFSIWTKDEVEYKILAYTSGDAISQFIKDSSYTLKEIMYVTETSERTL